VEGSPDLISPGMSVGPSREHRQDRRRRAAVAVAAAVAGGVGVGVCRVVAVAETAAAPS
jgi:hypothetical protein